MILCYDLRMKISGIVIEGQKKSALIGFPTANIKISRGIFSGIYEGLTELEDRKYKSAVYVGNKRPWIMEVHLIGFSQNIYGKKISVCVGEKIREDANEEDSEKLKRMIEEDVRKIKEIKSS